MLPFTREEFLSVFGSYNAAVWPAQPIAYALGAVALLALWRSGESYQRAALGILSAMWLWTGLAYHWLFFAEVNPAAVVFALLFFLQGLGFALVSSARQLPFRFRWRPGVQSVVGAALIGYAFVLYPLVDLLMGSWPRMPAFGISPCPVTLFTLGLLLLGQPRPRWWLWIIPVAWSLLGGTAAFLLGIPQDWVLLLGGPAALLIAFGRLPARPAPSNPIR